MPQSGMAALLRQRLPLQGAVNEPALAHWLPLLLPQQLPVMLAASSPVRDWLIWGGLPAQTRRCFSFRGASGIDGTLSLAMGLAMEQGPMVLVTGDLALLHDSNGWLHGAQGKPPLLVLLIDNQGGGIFQQLPIESKQFDRLFAMPSGSTHWPWRQPTALTGDRWPAWRICPRPSSGGWLRDGLLCCGWRRTVRLMPACEPSCAPLRRMQNLCSEADGRVAAGAPR